MAVAKKMLIKVNTVYIPGINDHHIPDIAKKISEMGVFIHNIIPLIAQAKFAHIATNDGGKLAMQRSVNHMSDRCHTVREMNPFYRLSWQRYQTPTSYYHASYHFLKTFQYSITPRIYGGGVYM